LFALHEAIGDQAFKKSTESVEYTFQSVNARFLSEVNKVSDFDTII
jgi:hypothetical protein